MRPKILVVDDDDLILELAHDALSSSFDVTLASTPSAAISLASTQDFAVICSDYSMPEMDGAEMLAHITNKTPSARSFLLTGSDFESAKSSRAAFAVLAKPFRPSELLELVRALSEGDLDRATQIVDRWNVKLTPRRMTLPPQ